MIRFTVHDRYATTASHLRPRSTAINPRYQVIDWAAGAVYDEFTTKHMATLTARDLNDLIPEGK